MRDTGLLGQLIQALCCLPGVGRKSAQRMAFYLLQRDRDGALRLARTLLESAERIGYCNYCRTLTESATCAICSDTSREHLQLCVVENPADVWVVEQAAFFRGLYFVLHGRLSPLDGIGPNDLGLPELERRLASGTLREIILATNSTVEGEATAHFIASLAERHGVMATRIAHGVPMGGELEFIDSTTLTHAFNGRKELN
ncbi:MAG: recombination mediator RecR [Gammaproteobacteria bacterium]